MAVTLVAIGSLAILTGAIGLFTEEALHRFRFLPEEAAISLLCSGAISALWGTLALQKKQPPLIEAPRVPMMLTAKLRENPYQQMTMGVLAKTELDSFVNKISHSDIRNFLDRVNKGDIASLFGNPQLLYVALAALKKHKAKISPFQVGTLALFDATLNFFNSSDLESLALAVPKTKPRLLHFNNGETQRLLTLSKKPVLVKEFTRYHYRLGYQKFIDNKYPLTESEFTEFLRHVATLPESEKYILHIPFTLFKNTLLSSIPMNESLAARLGFNPFLFYYEGGPQCLIPSLGIMEAYLVAKFGDKVPLAIPRFGSTTPKMIANDLLDNARVVGILHQNISFPLIYRAEADEAMAVGADFTLHDYYHLARAHRAPKKYRYLLAKLYLRLKRGFFYTVDLDTSSRIVDNNSFWEIMREYKKESRSYVAPEKLFEALWNMPEAHELNIFEFFETSTSSFLQETSCEYCEYLAKVKAAYKEKATRARER